jgi:glutamate-1-semialdehyde 2,1-aminomutase
MMEAATTVGPKDNFLHEVKKLCHKNGAIFIIDEMITGFRWHLQGAQKYFDIEPDLCTFGKAMANGFAVAALCGKRHIMELGGINMEGEERVFLMSTTHGAEMSALGAFLKTIEIIRRDNVIDHFWNYGKKLMDGLNDLAKALGIHDFFQVEGYPCSPNYITRDSTGKTSLPFRTLFSHEMIDNGVLIPYIAISHAHGEKELQMTLKAAEHSLQIYKKALREGIENYLHSPVIKPVFRKFN